MKIAVVLIVAYLAAAIFYVWRDITERNIARMKPYAMSYRRTGDLTTLLFAGIGWIIGVVANARMRGRISGYEAGPLAVFAVAATIIWFI